MNNLTKLKYVNANTFASMKKLKKLSLSNNFVLTEIDRDSFGTNQTRPSNLKEVILKKKLSKASTI